MYKPFGACLEQDLLSFIHDLALYSPLLHFVTFWAFYSISHVKVPPKIESAAGFYGSPWGDYLEMTDLCMKIGPFWGFMHEIQCFMHKMVLLCMKYSVLCIKWSFLCIKHCISCINP